MGGMRRILLIGLVSGLAAGCAAVKHEPTETVRVGRPYDVVVHVRKKEVASAEGEVHYRLPGSVGYRTEEMAWRGKELWASLPTTRVRGGERFEYFIDVRLDEEFYKLGSPGEPYVVRYLGGDTFDLGEMEPRVKYRSTGVAVRFELDVGKGVEAGAPVLTYQRPGVRGPISVRMQRKSGTTWFIEVPPRLLSSGEWLYHMTVEVGGVTYRMPSEGEARFWLPSQG